MDVTSAPLWLAPLAAVGLLAAGAYAALALDALVAARLVRRWRPSPLTTPLRHLAAIVVQQPTHTERPDRALALLSPAAYAGLIAAGLCVVPLADGWSIADLPAGLVLWGTVEALLIIAVFVHGWARNSPMALLAAYRYTAVGLSYILLSMFVLIAVALPAESLQLGAIVESQAGLWNVVRQPLGLPLFLVVALGATFWGPLNLADGTDVAGGTSAESAGAPWAAWMLARAAGLAAFAAMAATAFLGGWQGPWLPGPAWLAVKTLALLVALVTAGQLLARVPAERFVGVAWTVLLPLGFADLVIGAIGAV